jgi:hypothetical protein
MKEKYKQKYPQADAPEKAQFYLDSKNQIL